MLSQIRDIELIVESIKKFDYILNSIRDDYAFLKDHVDRSFEQILSQMGSQHKEKFEALKYPELLFNDQVAEIPLFNELIYEAIILDGIGSGFNLLNNFNNDPSKQKIDYLIKLNLISGADQESILSPTTDESIEKVIKRFNLKSKDSFNYKKLFDTFACYGLNFLYNKKEVNLELVKDQNNFIQQFLYKEIKSSVDFVPLHLILFLNTYKSYSQFLDKVPLLIPTGDVIDQNRLITSIDVFNNQTTYKIPSTKEIRFISNPSLVDSGGKHFKEIIKSNYISSFVEKIKAELDNYRKNKTMSYVEFLKSDF